MSRKTKQVAPIHIASQTQTSVAEALPVNLNFGNASYIALMAILAILTFFRLQLLEMPLERDEGGFAYIAQMMGRGANLYTDLRDIKLPGLYATYWAIMSVFGFTPQGIHAGLLCFNLITITLFFFLVKKMTDDLSAIIAAASYAILAVSPNLIGFATHATQLLVLPALAGIYLLLNALESKKWWQFFLAGLFMGYAFTIKQQAVYVMLFAGFYLLYKRYEGEKTAWKLLAFEMTYLVLGSLLPYLCIFFYMQMQGRMSEFWFWTFEWPREYGTNTTFSQSWGLFQFMFKRVTDGQLLLWLLGGVGMVALWLGKAWNAPLRVFASLLLLFLFLGVCTGFHFYQHYFVMLLPALCLLIGIAISQIFRLLHAQMDGVFAWGIVVFVFSLAWFQIILRKTDYFFKPNFTTIEREIYGTNPFPESAEIAAQLRARAKAGDEIAVFGSEPQIPFLANLPSASGHVFIYPLVDGGKHNERLQNEMIAEVSSKNPRFLVFVQNPASWLSRNDRLEKWMREYVSKNNYQPIGMVDIFGGGQATQYVWGDAAPTYQLQSSSGVYVFEKK